MKQDNFEKRSRIDRGWERMELLLEQDDKKRFAWWPMGLLMVGIIMGIGIVMSDFGKKELDIKTTAQKTDIQQNQIERQELKSNNINDQKTFEDNAKSLSKEIEEIIKQPVKEVKQFPIAAQPSNLENDRVEDQTSKKLKREVDAVYRNDLVAKAILDTAELSLGNQIELMDSNHNTLKPFVDPVLLQQIEKLYLENMLLPFSNESITGRDVPFAKVLPHKYVLKSESGWNQYWNIGLSALYNVNNDLPGVEMTLSKSFENRSLSIEPYLGFSYINTNLNAYNFTYNSGSEEIRANVSTDDLETGGAVSEDLEDEESAVNQDFYFNVNPRSRLAVDVGVLVSKKIRNISFGVGGGLDFYFNDFSIDSELAAQFNSAIPSLGRQFVQSKNQFAFYSAARIALDLNDRFALYSYYKYSHECLLEVTNFTYRHSRLGFGVRCKL